MAAHNDLGTWGEEQAEQYLRLKGYGILHRDWKYRHYDLDIVAYKDGMVIFVEVKTRRDDYLMLPEQAVDRKKIRSLTIASSAYIKLFRVDADVRFDIISIVGRSDDDMKINHIEDAFLPLPY